MLPSAPFPLHRDTPWFPLLKRWVVALFLGCLASLHAQASTVGTSIDFWSENNNAPYQWNIEPLAVGSGIELEVGAFRFDVDPVAETFTIDVYHADSTYRKWDLDNLQFSAAFSGGTLGQFTSITRTGGTASDAASYSATVNDKTLTFIVPPGTVAQGTIVFTFASTTAAPAPPTVTSVLPNSGFTAGGTLTGTNFTPGSTVTFGGSSATGVTVNSATTFTATTPAHAAGLVNVEVTTPGGSATLTNGYTYAVPSSNASLSGLALSAGVLSPAFTTGNQSYTAAVNHAVNSIAVTPTLADVNATVTVNGAVGGPISLNPGANVITVVVTAQNGTAQKSYTVTVTRASTALAASPSWAHVSCNGGSNGTASVSPSGGVGPYTYL